MSHISDPAVHAAAIVPSDTADLSSPVRSIYVGGTGNITLTTYGGETVLLSAVPVGILAVQAKRIWATGTTATNMVGLW